MNVKIFTMTHKKFDEPKDSIYIPLHVGRAAADDLGYAGDDTGDSISERNKYYGELTGVYWVWKNVRDADIVGICHYRRYFLNQESELLSQKEYEDILKEYDVITSNDLKSNKSYRELYEEAHNIEDLNLTENIIKKKFPEYANELESVLSGNTGYYGNLMVTSKNLFDSYAQWLFSIFFEMEKQIDVSSYDLYHQRVFGFLSEQLLKVWIQKHNLKVYEGIIGITSEKAETTEFKLAMAQLVKMGKISEARQMFYEYLKLRPDVRLELSDLRGEIPIIEQLLYIAEQEQERGITGLNRNGGDLNAWIVHYRRTQQCLADLSSGEEVRQEDISYILEKNVSWVMCKVMMMNDIGEKITNQQKNETASL
ncbi:hypothetical protein C823_005486 [Eubacterium plexicaudatum ASF492]|uniref:DUF4422 domain-containing protein n=1 Tax=Eubacterium plexicaudatum ASF492 TaxID=1235802 RepID=N2B5E0_9FIRM|nr:hypothetical protein C823_005486 [Eubacterium plexicaudatum ASF492]